MPKVHNAQVDKHEDKTYWWRVGKGLWQFGMMGREKLYRNGVNLTHLIHLHLIYWIDDAVMFSIGFELGGAGREDK